eukprot:4224381-Amphidinium_carterae.1
MRSTHRAPYAEPSGTWYAYFGCFSAAGTISVTSAMSTSRCARLHMSAVFQVTQVLKLVARCKM